MVYRLHGLSPAEVYICTDAGLLCWNGQELTEFEGPDDEPLGVLVLSREELLVVGDGVHHWSDKAGWTDLESPVDSHAAEMMSLGEDVFIPTLDGVLRLRSGEFDIVVESRCNKVLSVGNAILAAGTGGLVSFDGKSWLRLFLPVVVSEEDPL